MTQILSITPFGEVYLWEIIVLQKMMFCKRGGEYDEESNYATISRSLVFGDEEDAIDDTLYFWLSPNWHISFIAY